MKILVDSLPYLMDYCPLYNICFLCDDENKCPRHYTNRRDYFDKTNSFECCALKEFDWSKLEADVK